jgi:hypothetical protein
MTWPVLPASTVVAHVFGSTVVLDQGSGVLARIDGVGAFVLDHRELFSDHRDAAVELSALLDGEVDAIERDLRALEVLLGDLASDEPGTVAPDYGPVRSPPGPRAAVHTWCIDALGVAIEVRCHDPALVETVAPMLAAYPPARSAPVHRFDVWEDSGITVTQDDRIVVERAGLDAAVGALIAGITVLAIVADRDALLLHAAAVTDDTSAILIGGGSGAGKTTTTVELVAGGLAFLTDELVELDPATGTVHGLARPVGLEGPARSWRPELRPVWASAEQHRWPVPPRAIGALADQGRAALIVHLEFAESDATTVEALELLPALGRLCAVTFNRQSLTETALVQLAELLGRVPSILVRHDGAPHAASAIIERWAGRGGVERRRA